jgi:hypothetical protein
MAIENIWRSFGIFYDHFLHSVSIWYIFPVWVSYLCIPRKIWQPCSGEQQQGDQVGRIYAQWVIAFRVTRGVYEKVAENVAQPIFLSKLKHGKRVISKFGLFLQLLKTDHSKFSPNQWKFDQSVHPDRFRWTVFFTSWATFSHCLSNVLISTKNGLGYSLGDFFHEILRSLWRAARKSWIDYTHAYLHPYRLDHTFTFLRANVTKLQGNWLHTLGRFF